MASVQANPVTDVIAPGAKVVAVDAIVRLPALGAREYAAAKVMAETMADEVDGYSQGDMRDMGARAGESLKITLMPDHIRIEFGALPAEADTAISYVGHILKNSRFPEDSIAKAEAEIPFRKKSLWATAIQPVKFDFRRVRREDVLDMYHRICRPENVWLCVGGPIDARDAENAWSAVLADWTVTKPPRLPANPTPLGEASDVPGRETMVELRGSSFPGNDPAMPTKLLALIGLGCGKGAAMFQTLRETEGWSYRQEAFLWPTPEGFEPRLIMASGDKTAPDDLAKGMRDQLILAVKNWDASDLARAEGMAQGIFERGFAMSPLYFNSSWPISGSLEDETFLAGYWTMKTGSPWNASRMLGEMALVSLSDFKDAAMEILTDSKAHVLPARG
ncbi:MAG TPA: insulinase family protein [Fimbriimonadaceae bacterium]|nr:insulinase family protein [Fimbriimonadaceae bacterium]